MTPGIAIDRKKYQNEMRSTIRSFFKTAYRIKATIVYIIFKKNMLKHSLGPIKY